MIIKCPECGRQVSEKAPTCPSCGVEIAGKVTRCNNCGEVYFTEDGICPACQQTNNASTSGSSYRPVTPVNTDVPKPVVETQRVVTPPEKPVNRPSSAPQQPSKPNNNGATGVPPKGPMPSEQQAPKKRNYTSIIVAFLFALITLGVLWFFYNRAQNDREYEDYEFAMRSSDPEVLQSYLLRYTDAPAEHRDSIQAHLLIIQKGDEDWQNAVLSNSRSALQLYLDKNPDSVHRQEALNKIDSLDWITASKSESQEAVEDYIKQHAEGRYIDDAKELLSKIKRSTVQADERSMITAVFRQFFQSVNSRDEARLIETVSMVMENFLGKPNASSDDAITFMRRIYRDDISNMNWHIDNQSYKMDKREVAENEYEYNVTFNARKEIERNGETSSENYRVTATVSNNKISSFNLTKLN